MSEQPSKNSGPLLPPEVPEADGLEQSRDADPESVPARTRPPKLGEKEASEADLLEQSQEVPIDDDLYG
jgi:hypothetical protein